MKRWMAMVLAGLVGAGVMAGCNAGPMGSGAKDMQLLSQAKQAALACLMFASEHNDALPASLADLATGDGSSADLSQFELVAKGKLSELGNPMTTVLLKSKTLTSSGKRAVAYADGHCELVAGP